MVRVVDQRFPAGKRLPVEIAVLERIAEHAERVDRHVGVADRLAKLARQPRQVLVHRLPEERLDALEPESDDLAHIGRRIRRVRLDHGADADVEQVSHWRLRSNDDVDAPAGLGALDGAEDHRERADVVPPDGFGLASRPDRRNEVQQNAKMTADAVLRREWRRLDRVKGSNRPSRSPAPRTSIRI